MLDRKPRHGPLGGLGVAEARFHIPYHPPMPTLSEPVFATNLNLPGRRQGKVRDVYEFPGNRLLIVASDRISAFDVVMPTPIPGKGRLLTEISTFWFRFIEERQLAKTHLISTNEADIPAAAIKGTTREQLAGRITIGSRCKVVPIECVVRGYLEGSGWKDYQASGSVCGVKLPAGLRQCDKLPQPIFTPATKAPQGQHDENISFEQACDEVGKELMTKLRDRTIAIYTAAADFARSRGIIIADTKFEFGLLEGTPDPILIDEALTPDSSRFWPADTYQPGKAQKSFDKQFLREYLQSLVDRGQWNKQAPGPELPAHIVEGTLAKYAEARDRLCG
jgi:phosphoribosylaminoimidazole-succinocarboxamide synthase